ncbi:hypothetical protein P6F26_08040 [Roseibacterium sp. SDUM158017]|uniref:hypothetical protein n=1 Tax=Roseicyclus salinarum TaxID=3036773 RepID=UPI002414DF44|nr:hypothetical protein [Roseibacterium sp. SDUM158017]MDG4648393.1 hypothetical protein [Roseibacterium sp. SDUM158017]
MNTSGRTEKAHLCIAAGIVAAAALAGAWAPANLMGVVAVFALMRICWLEDNITNDLVGRDRLPGDYVNTAIRRGNFLRRWFGMEPAEDASALPPHQLATAMRAEIQVWGCALLGMCATLVAKADFFGQPLDLALGAVLFLVALRRADRLVVSLAHCAEGRALPRRLLLPTRRRTLREKD